MPTTTTLNRNQTDLMLSMRSFSNESKTNGDAIGDWFRSIGSYGDLTNQKYNALVDLYNGWEDLADASALEGTDPSGGNFGVASLPSRPRPIHK